MWIDRLRLGAAAMGALLALAFAAAPVRAQSEEELKALNAEVVAFFKAGRFAEALPAARRHAELTSARHGEEAPEYASSISNLASVLEEGFARYAEAEALKRQALAIDERRLEPEHPSLALRLNNLAALLVNTSRLAEAEPLMRRALAIREKELGLDDPEVAQLVNNLAILIERQGRYGEAETLLRRALAIREKGLAADDPEVAQSLNNLAALILEMNRTGEAEVLYRRALAIDEKGLGPEHPGVARDLNNLAQLLLETQRFADAEPLMRRAIAIFEKVFGPEHPNLASALNNLARLLEETNRRAEAEPLMRRTLAIDEKALGPAHPQVAVRLNNLATLLKAANRIAEAEAPMRRALAIVEAGLGPEHPRVAVGLNNLAQLLQDDGRLAEAEPLLQRALAIDEKVLGPAHPKVALRLSNLASLRAAEGDWQGARGLYRRALPILTAARPGDEERTGLARSALAASTWDLRAAAVAFHRADPGDAEAREAAFVAAQWAQQSEAADALAQMSVRFARGGGALSQLVRRRQDLLALRRAELKRLDAAAGEADARAADAARATVAAHDRELDAVDARIAVDFKEYAALAAPRPLSIAEVQGLIGEREAVVVILDVPRFGMLAEASLVWIVTKTEARWYSSNFGTQALGAFVAGLRCGLDAKEWEGSDTAQRCAAHLGLTAPPDSSRPLPFHLGAAHTLYTALLGQAEDLIADKHLLIVASGPLTSLPFNVLVTRAPATDLPASPGEYRAAAWLGVRNPISVLPAVASLKSVRQQATPSRARKPYLGIGNPLLEGGGALDQRRAQLALSKQACPRSWGERIAWAARRPLQSFRRIFARGTQADIEDVRRWSPLPETADELCEVRRQLGAAESDVLLGQRATEAALKDISASGSLAEHAIVHFATHGALTNDVKGIGEPGLVLTPPAKGTADPMLLERDDGFLTASEIAELRLDAEWVVLSACNTAGGSGESAEALSGIARAFFYAGARALLVSHWPVGSDAAVKLTTRAFAEMKGDRTVGRAEAMRRSMRSLVEKGSAAEAHPSLWAPFVVVGEGAVR